MQPSQAYVLALPCRPPVIWQDEAIGKKWQDTKEADKNNTTHENGCRENEDAQAREQYTQEEQIGPLTFSAAPDLTDHEVLELTTSADHN